MRIHRRSHLRFLNRAFIIYTSQKIYLKRKEIEGGGRGRVRGGEGWEGQFEAGKKNYKRKKAILEGFSPSNEGERGGEGGRGGLSLKEVLQLYNIRRYICMYKVI